MPGSLTGRRWSTVRDPQDVPTPDEISPDHPLQHVTNRFDCDCQPLEALDLLFADESIFMEQQLMKFQNAEDGVEVDRWAPKEDETNCFQRMVRFVQRIPNPLSPVKRSACTWFQRYYLVDGETAVVLTKSDLLEVPFGDAWSLYIKWVFGPHQHGFGSVATFSMQTVFHKSLLWRSKIENEAVRLGMMTAPRLATVVNSFLARRSRNISSARRLSRLTQSFFMGLHLENTLGFQSQTDEDEGLCVEAVLALVSIQEATPRDGGADGEDEQEEDDDVDGLADEESVGLTSPSNAGSSRTVVDTRADGEGYEC